jgi:hypothetical protein
LPDLAKKLAMKGFQTRCQMGSIEHVEIIERSLLRDLNQAMQQATSGEQCAILEDQELALIDAVSRWARSKGLAKTVGGNAVRCGGSRVSLRRCFDLAIRHFVIRLIFGKCLSGGMGSLWNPLSPFS